MLKAGAKNNHFYMEEQTMSKKAKTKKVEKQLINTEPDEKELKKAWLDNYIAPKNTAARLCTQALLKGTTLSEMKQICKEYAEKNGNKQRWGTSKNSDLTGHCRWLKGKGFTVNTDETGCYRLTV